MCVGTHLMALIGIPRSVSAISCTLRPCSSLELRISISTWKPIRHRFHWTGQGIHENISPICVLSFQSFFFFFTWHTEYKGKCLGCEREILREGNLAASKNSEISIRSVFNVLQIEGQWYLFLCWIESHHGFTHCTGVRRLSGLSASGSITGHSIALHRWLQTNSTGIEKPINERYNRRRFDCLKTKRQWFFHFFRFQLFLIVKPRRAPPNVPRHSHCLRLSASRDGCVWLRADALLTRSCLPRAWFWTPSCLSGCWTIGCFRTLAHRCSLALATFYFLRIRPDGKTKTCQKGVTIRHCQWWPHCHPDECYHFFANGFTIQNYRVSWQGR